MPSLKAVFVEELEEEAGFGVKITDGGINAYLHSRKPSRHELVDAVPELGMYPMERVEEGVLCATTLKAPSSGTVFDGR